MRIAPRSFACVITVTLCVGFLLKGDVAPRGTWVVIGSMSEVRDGADSVLLRDGRLLITGGKAPDGVLDTVEIVDGLGFSPLPSMLEPRHRHSSLLLENGRVLVTGGTGAGGSAIAAAEIFDPDSSSWHAVGEMLESRSGHAAVLLKDGRVLVAGGSNAGGAVQTVEIFDPVAEGFFPGGYLSSPRQNLAVAVLADGKVLLSGGSDGYASLSSVDIYDPVAGSVIAGPPMQTGRAGHTATALLNGNVFVAGGSDGERDLASAEIFDEEAGSFRLLPATLSVPRKDHLAFLLPDNNSVLIVGGNSEGVQQKSADLFLPWSESFQVTGPLSVARPGATGSPLGLEGLLLLAGGNGRADAELYGYSTVRTDRDDYAHGSRVVITGTGWQPAETVHLVLEESPVVHPGRVLTAVADSSGRIYNDQFSPEEQHLVVRFHLTATGSRAQAQNTFTGGVEVGSVDVGSRPVVRTLTHQNYTGSANGMFSIEKSNTTVTLTSSANPSILAQSIRFTATISAGSSAGGTVLFRIDGADFGSPVPVSGGSATSVAITWLSIGRHTITALYGGDQNLNGSFTDLTQRVQYMFSGFGQPIGPPDTGTLAATFNLGKTVPVKWQLKDAKGNYIKGLFTISSLEAATNSSCSGAYDGTAFQILFDTTDSRVLRYESGSNQYVFNWETTGKAPGCYTLILSLIDETRRSVIIKLR